MQKEHEGETKICDRCRKEKVHVLLSLFHPTVTAFLRSAGNAKRRSALQAKAQRKQWPRTPQTPCPIPGMVMRNGAPIHVETALPDTPEMFCYVADLVKSCCDSYVIGLTSAMRRYSSGMGSEEHDAQILELVRQTNAQVLTILNERMKEK